MESIRDDKPKRFGGLQVRLAAICNSTLANLRDIPEAVSC